VSPTDWENDLDVIADRYERFTAEVERILGGEPTLVTDKDGITRPTWEREVPWDWLYELCQTHNIRNLCWPRPDRPPLDDGFDIEPD
jgi:hypothetical protein